jgi:agmatine deiminase
MGWPERTDTWRDGAKPAQRAFAEVAAAISAAEPVTVAASARQWANARATLAPEVRVVELGTDDAWFRDVGPTWLVGPDGERRGVDWRFNAYGGPDHGLYFPYDRDAAAAAKVLEVEGHDRYACALVAEGGAVHVDGAGTVLTTEQCLLDPHRNPDRSKADVERVLVEYLGAERVVWLGQGVVDDETGGHVDNLACFVRPGVVLLTWTDDPSDPQHSVSVDARRRLEEAGLEVLVVEQPGPLYLHAHEAAGLDQGGWAKPRLAGDRLAGSYVNAYVATTRLVVPLLDPRTDEAALAVYAEAFPDRQVVGVASREVLLGGGNIHCITQQIPA